ncbi:MAG TPA: MerR family transcriptional regulator [Bauldia sp.]|nr:MerR family transcriptional regulator [Bauldia sp.]
MASKGPQAFRTISEVAQELDLPQHVLRFWETRFTQIRPMKRGGGRRYYRPDDIDLLRGIRTLLYGEGYTIRGVQRILREQGPRFVIGAGRGDMSGVFAPSEEDADDDATIVQLEGDEDVADEMEVEEVGEDDDRVEPAFDPREFRLGSAPVADDAPETLAPEDIRRLEGTLSQLLELKRLLDQARD